MKNKLIPKHQKAGKLLKNEPVQDGTYVEQPRLNLQEQELLNFIQSNPTSEQIYFRDLAIKNGEFPVWREVLKEAKKDNAKNNFFRGYNNFRYSHPWAKGLNYTPIIGDVMDVVGIGQDLNNGQFASAAVRLGLAALPNVVGKSAQKSVKKYIPEIIDEQGQKRIDSFYNEVTLPKYRANRGDFSNQHEDVPGEFIYLRRGDSRRLPDAHGHSYKGTAYIYEGSPVDPEEIVIHEGIHNKRDYSNEAHEEWNEYVNSELKELGIDLKTLSPSQREQVQFYMNQNYRPNNPNLYTKNEIDLLDNAYDLSDSVEDVVQIAEKGAINTQMQYYLFKHLANGDATKMNHIIDNLDNTQILELLSTAAGQYGEDIARTLIQLPEETISESVRKIKNALKIVPAMLPFGITVSQKEKEFYKQGGRLISKHDLGNPIKKQEPIRDNTNVNQKPLGQEEQYLIDNPPKYDNATAYSISRWRNVPDRKPMVEETPKKKDWKLTPRKHTRPAPAFITNSRYKNNA